MVEKKWELFVVISTLTCQTNFARNLVINTEIGEKVNIERNMLLSSKYKI